MLLATKKGERSEASEEAVDGLAIEQLLRLPSLPLRFADWLTTTPCAGCLLSPFAVPLNVFAVRDNVRAVEGEAFASSEGVHVAIAFELLCAQVTRTPLNLAGRIFVQQFFNRVAFTRARVYEHIARNPSIASQPIVAPIFIIGLPRTGSSHLQALLSADRLTETLKLYEMMQPLPLCNPGSFRARVRAQNYSTQQGLVDMLAPGWTSANGRFHKVGMDQPEEEAVLLAGCGISMMPFVCLGGAGTEYERAHEDPTSKRAACRYLRRFLQLMATTRPQGAQSRWVLKSHYNALWVDALLAEFPDSKVIITVRDPIEVVQSFISYSIVNLSFIAADGSGAEVARGHAAAAYSYLRANARALVALQKRHGSSGSLHVAQYKKLVAEPFVCMREIYAQFGIPLTDDALSRATQYLQDSQQHSLGKPTKLALAEAGLSNSQIERDFADYRAVLLNAK